MKTSLKLSNAQAFFDAFTPTQEGYSTPSEILLALEKKTKDVKYFIELEDVEMIQYKDDGHVIFEVRNFDIDIYGNRVLIYEYMDTVS
jgi:hypothetical protein